MHILSNCIQNEQICEQRWITYRAEQEEPAAVFQKHGVVIFQVLVPFPAYPEARHLISMIITAQMLPESLICTFTFLLNE